MGIALNGWGWAAMWVISSIIVGMASALYISERNGEALKRNKERDAEEKRLDAWHTGRRKIEIEIENMKCSISSVKNYQREHLDRIHNINLSYQYYKINVDNMHKDCGTIRINDDFISDPFKMFFASCWNENQLNQNLIALRKEHDSY